MQVYIANERRYNYTTPKSFLELINLYLKVLQQKHYELEGKTKRLENGLEKLRVTAEQVRSVIYKNEAYFRDKNDSIGFL